jgi:hypothetical protein
MKAFYLVRSDHYDLNSFVFFANAVADGLGEGDIVRSHETVNEDEFRILTISKMNHPDTSHRLNCERITRPGADKEDGSIPEIVFAPGTRFDFVSASVGEYQ